MTKFLWQRSSACSNTFESTTKNDAIPIWVRFHCCWPQGTSSMVWTVNLLTVSPHYHITLLYIEVQDIRTIYGYLFNEKYILLPICYFPVLQSLLCMYHSFVHFQILFLNYYDCRMYYLFRLLRLYKPSIWHGGADK
jgi:hypothetical protein